MILGRRVRPANTQLATRTARRCRFVDFGADELAFLSALSALAQSRGLVELTDFGQDGGFPSKGFDLLNDDAAQFDAFDDPRDRGFGPAPCFGPQGPLPVLRLPFDDPRRADLQSPLGAADRRPGVTVALRRLLQIVHPSRALFQRLSQPLAR